MIRSQDLRRLSGHDWVMVLVFSGAAVETLSFDYGLANIGSSTQLADLFNVLLIWPKAKVSDFFFASSFLFLIALSSVCALRAKPSRQKLHIGEICAKGVQGGVVGGFVGLFVINFKNEMSSASQIVTCAVPSGLGALLGILTGLAFNRGNRVRDILPTGAALGIYGLWLFSYVLVLNHYSSIRSLLPGRHPADLGFLKDAIILVIILFLVGVLPRAVKLANVSSLVGWILLSVWIISALMAGLDLAWPKTELAQSVVETVLNANGLPVTGSEAAALRSSVFNHAFGRDLVLLVGVVGAFSLQCISVMVQRKPRPIAEVSSTGNPV